MYPLSAKIGNSLLGLVWLLDQDLTISNVVLIEVPEVLCVGLPAATVLPSATATKAVVVGATLASTACVSMLKWLVWQLL